MIEIDVSEVGQAIPVVCVVCGSEGELRFSPYVFSYKTLIGVLGGFFAGLFSFGILTVNLSYNLEHKIRVRFCSKCVRRAERSERNGITAAVMVLAGGFILSVVMAVFVGLLPLTPLGSFLTKLPNLGAFFYGIFDNSLLLLVGGFFAFAMLSPVARLVAENWSKPKAVISRTYVLLKIPGQESVKIRVGQPKVKLDVG